MKKNYWRPYFFVLLATLTIVGCTSSQSSLSGKTVTMTPKEMRDLQEKYHANVVTYRRIYQNSVLQKYIDDLAAEILSANGEDVGLNITLMDVSSLNLLVRPLGYVYIDRGLIAHLNTKDQLAAVLATAAAHVIRRHPEKQAERNRSAQLMTLLMDMLGNVKSEGNSNSPVLPNSIFTQALLENSEVEKFSHLNLFRQSPNTMLDADTVAQKLLLESGYSDRALLELYDLMSRYAAFTGKLGQFAPLSVGHDHLYFKPTGYRKKLAELLGEVEPLATTGEFRLPQLDAKFSSVIQNLPHGSSYQSAELIDGKFIDPESASVLEFPEGWAAWSVGKPTRISLLDNAKGKRNLLLSSFLTKEGEKEESYLSRILPEHNSFQKLDQRIYRVGFHEPEVKGAENVKKNFRSGLIRFDRGRAFHILVDNNLPELEPAILEVARSLRPATAEDLSILTRRKIELVRAQTGETLKDMVNKSMDIHDIEKQLRLLNGFHPIDEIDIGDGQWIKVIVDSVER